MDINRYKSIFSNFKDKNILVIGDLMLDTYIWGVINRVSPEAPVPIVDVDKINSNPGGAANVALNLRSLGSAVSVLGLVGDDDEGFILKEELSKSLIEIDHIITSVNRPTTVKTRIIAHDRQIVRTDRELSDDIDDKLINRAISAVENIVNDFDGIIIEDYNKGFLNKKSIPGIIAVADEANVPIYVDPKKRNFNLYNNVRFLKPNLIEFNYSFPSDDSLSDSGFALIKKMNLDILLVTHGSDGMSLFNDSDHYHIPTIARNVHDVSGAGDTVIATFSLSDLSGATPYEASELANFAAGRVCEEVGAISITVEMMNDVIEGINA